VKQILSFTKKKKVIITKSTVPVGTAKKIENVINE
jgi:UDP-glucose 6-dehydrogenase